MPLIKSPSKEALKENIATEITEGEKDPSQAAAIAYSEQREAKKVKKDGEFADEQGYEQSGDMTMPDGTEDLTIAWL